MANHPIIFSAEMVRAIVDGRKTQTRRVIRNAPSEFHGSVEGVFDRNVFEWIASLAPQIDYFPKNEPRRRYRCPYGRRGDRLWVRETWQSGNYACNEPRGAVYRATDPDWEDTEGWQWRPAIFMPRWASRITLEIISIRVERVQEISEADALAEGVRDRFDGTTFSPVVYEYQKLWDILNAKRGYPWSSNPWVWVIEFGRLT